MTAFPKSHVCPLAVEWNKFRCPDLTGKPDKACDKCRAALTNELERVMLEGDASFFEMLFVGHVLEREGFVGAPDEDGGIQMKRARGKRTEEPGDCIIKAISPVLGGGYSFFICIDDDHEITELPESMEEAIACYFDNKDVIGELARGGIGRASE